MNGAMRWIEHPLVPGVRAISTLRAGTGDDFGWVDGSSARRDLIDALRGTVAPVWLQQVHGIDCVDLDAPASGQPPVADAAFTRVAGRGAVVLTADCLPLLLASRDGQIVAAIHAGWRGLAAGVIATAVRRMAVDPATLVGVFGPAIGPGAYEVGPELREAFVRQNPESESAFRQGSADRWFADLYRLAQQQLDRLGVNIPQAPGWCTHSEARFHSWRRDGQAAGRMAHLIWREQVIPDASLPPIT